MEEIDKVSPNTESTKKRKRAKNRASDDDGSVEGGDKITKVPKATIAKDNYLDTMAEESDDEYRGAIEYDDSEEDEMEDTGPAIPDEMKDFIIDEAEEEEEEEDASDVEYEPDKLDEEDLELIAENTGSKWKDKDEDEDDDRSKQLRRLKKSAQKKKTKDDVFDDEWYDDEPSRAFELSDVWATVIECFGEVDLVIQILKNERVSQQPEEQIESDYELEQDEAPSKREEQISWDNYADPDELVREYLTKEDNEIRLSDQPERLFIRYKNRDRITSTHEIQAESQWMAKRLVNEFNRDLSKENIKKSYENIFKASFPCPDTTPIDDVTEKCELVLGWLLNERLEVPFILCHKRHLICPPLTDAIVWRIYQLDSEWLRLRSLSNDLQNSIEKIQHQELPNDIIYFSIYFDGVEDLLDVSNHLNCYYHTILNPQQVKPISIEDSQKIDDDVDEDIEDDIFGDFVPIDEHVTNPVHNTSPPSSPEGIYTELPHSEDPSFTSMEFPGTNPVYGTEDSESGSRSANTVEEAKELSAEGTGGNWRISQSPYHMKSLPSSPGTRSLSEMDEADYLPEEVGDEKRLVKSPELDDKKVHKRRNLMMHLIESCEQYGLHEVWNGYVATPNQFYTVLEKGVVSGPTEFKVQLSDVRDAWSSMGVSGVMSTPSVESNVEQQVEDICAQYCTGPYTTGKRVYKTLIDYHAKKLASHISIRRLLREYYRNYCSITCTTTPKGELDVDPSDRSWFCRRLYRLPLYKMLSFDQLSYDYPKNLRDRESRLKYLEERRSETRLVELYLELVDLEKKGAIDVTIHPLNGAEVSPWKDDKYKQRFADWYEKFKQLTYSGKQVVNDAYREQLEHQKSLLEKEEEALNEAEEKDRHWRRNLLDQLSFAYCPSNIASQSVWRYVQRAILDRLINVELIPKFRREVSEMLLKNAQQSVLIHSQRMLEYKLDVLPTFTNVISLVHDSPAEGLKVYCSIVNEFGEVLGTIILENILSVSFNTKSAGYTSLPNFQQMMSDVDDLLKELKTFNVSTILIGLTSVYSLDLYSRLEQYLLPKCEVKIDIRRIGCEVPRLMGSLGNVSSDLFQSKPPAGRSVTPNNAAGVNVPKEGIMSLSLARWYINPLAETLNLWRGHNENILLRLRLHPLQHLIPVERFQSSLESTLVSVVCEAGVDIIRVKRCPHYEAQLQFVAGLGPRKSLELLRSLKLSTITTRGHLRAIRDDIIGNVVFRNCSSFIRINANEATDPLDTTRIHPIESGFIAEKLCSGSLDDELAGEEAVQEILANPKRLDDLDLEAYSLLLYERQEMPRMLPYLLFVKDELQNPYRDARAKLKHLHPEDVFYQSLQLEKDELKYGTHVLCRLDDIFEKFVRATVLPYNLRAQISDFYQFKSDLQRNLKDSSLNLKGETVPARIVKLDFVPINENGRNAFKVEVSLTTHQRKYLLSSYLSDLMNHNLEEFLSPLVKLDVNYSKRHSFNEKKKIQYRRAIRHPCYRMWPIHKTVSFLKQTEIPVGECCICPMSEWDRLSLVIKTCMDPFNCATFVIHEKNQRIPGELGKDLYIQKERFSNLDQIIAQFCETLKLNLEEFYMHPKYRQSADFAKVERDLIQESALKPDSITWAILPPNPRRKDSNNETINNPLRFTLMVIPPGFSMISHDCKSLQDPIYVDHKSFRLWTHSEKSLRDLINWWKQYGYWHRNTERQKYLDEKKKFMDEYSKRQQTRRELY